MRSDPLTSSTMDRGTLLLAVEPSRLLALNDIFLDDQTRLVVLIWLELSIEAGWLLLDARSHKLGLRDGVGRSEHVEENNVSLVGCDVVRFEEEVSLGAVDEGADVDVEGLR